MSDSAPSAAEFTIIGAGPVGTLMAVLLAQHGRRVRLYERRADPRLVPPEHGRSINLALAARGLQTLEQAGLAAHIAPHWVAMRGRMVHEARAEPRLLPYSRNAGELLYSIGRDQLGRLLIEAAGRLDAIELRFQTRCIDVDPLAGTVQLEHLGARQTCRFDVLLAADGAGSAVRAALVRRGLSAAIEQDLGHDYKELAIGALDGGYAFEPHALHIWPRGGYMLIALPNPGGTFTATLFLPRHGDPSFDRLCDERAVRDFFTEQFPDAALVLDGLERQFRLHPQSRLGSVHCECWQLAGRVLLLGDAAHAIVPFHGQGLNCGFEDCHVLDQLLAGNADIADAFEQFERLRRREADAIAAMALENYVEMREGVRSPQFASRQALAAQLEQHFPQRFIPRYSMVMFHPEIPYAEAQQRGAQQQRLLDALAARCGAGPLDEHGLTFARQLLAEQGL